MSIANLKQWATYAVHKIGGKSENWVAIAAQWVQEKGWQWWDNPQPPYNVGNIKDIHGNFRQFPSLQSGVDGYCDFLTVDDKQGYYRQVVNALKTGSINQVLQALAESPYCYPHYNVSDLENIATKIEKQAGETAVPNTLAQLEQQAAQIKAQITALQKELSKIEAEIAAEQKKQQKAQANASGAEYVTVTKNPPYNTLWGIAQAKLGNGTRWHELLKLNPGIIPSRLQVGQKVRVK